MEKEDYGKCLFCGTAIPIPLDIVEAEKEEKDDYAVMHCDCAEAEAYRARVRAEKERMETLKRAAEEIEQLFGESAADFGFGPATPRVTDVLKELSVLAYDGEIGSGKIDIPGDSKAAIGINAKGVITVMRTKTTAAKREV